MRQKVSNSVTIFADNKTFEAQMVTRYEENGYVIDTESLRNRKAGDGIVMVLLEDIDSD